MTKVSICDNCGEQRPARGTRQETGGWISLHVDLPRKADEDDRVFSAGLCSAACLTEWSKQRERPKDG